MDANHVRWFENIIVQTRANKNMGLPETSILMKFLHFFRNVSTNNGRSNRNLYEQNTGKQKQIRCNVIGALRSKPRLPPPAPLSLSPSLGEMKRIFQ